MFLWLPSILRSKESWPLDKEKYSNFNYPMFPGYFDSQNIWDMYWKTPTWKRREFVRFTFAIGFTSNKGFVRAARLLDWLL